MQTPLLRLAPITQQPCFAAETENTSKEAWPSPLTKVLWELEAAPCSKTSIANELVTSPSRPILPHIWHTCKTFITLLM